MKQKIALLGSTGSIGTQTLDTVRNLPNMFEITTLTSHNNWQLLARQAVEFDADSVVIANKEHYAVLKAELSSYPIKVYAGCQALEQIVAGDNVDVVVNALVGYAGLAPSVATLKAGKKLALANKESLVVAGELLVELSRVNKAPILPIDSEHSAVFQCLTGEQSPVHKIILTASGGPFLDMSTIDMERVSVAQALNHPRWKMGQRITIDSATLMNKGFEVIEARWLFGLDGSKIDVVIHPESVVHSMVEFCDGALKAQLGTPDMHLPIQYALTYPVRLEANYPRFDVAQLTQLNFRQPDTVRFPALRLAYESLGRGGNSCCVLNAADEVAVAAFLGGKIGFTQIVKVIENTLSRVAFVAKPTMDDYEQSDRQAREIAQSLIK